MKFNLSFFLNSILVVIAIFGIWQFSQNSVVEQKMSAAIYQVKSSSQTMLTGITGSCQSSSGATVGVNIPVTWAVNVNKGTSLMDSYTYSWSGTDSLSGNTTSVVKKYYTTGNKTASVTVKKISGSNLGSVTFFCGTVTVNNYISTTINGNSSISTTTPASTTSNGKAVTTSSGYTTNSTNNVTSQSSYDLYSGSLFNINEGKASASDTTFCSQRPYFKKTFTNKETFPLIVNFTGSVDDVLLVNGKLLSADKGKCNLVQSYNVSFKVNPGSSISFGAGDNSLSNVSINGTVSASAPSQCSIIAVNGFSSENWLRDRFSNVVSKIVSGDPRFASVTVSPSFGTDIGQPQSLITQAKNILSGSINNNSINNNLINNNSAPNSVSKKLLVVGHSYGAWAAYVSQAGINSAVKKGTKVDYLFYDPPYNVPGTGWGTSCFASFFTGVLNWLGVVNRNYPGELKAIKDAGIATDSRTIDWTNGLTFTLFGSSSYKCNVSDNNNQTIEIEGKKAAHTAFNTDVKVLYRINNWLEKECVDNTIITPLP